MPSLLLDRVRRAWRGLRAETTEQRPPWGDYWYTAAGAAAAKSIAGVHVTADTALTVGAVYRAVQLLAGDVAQLPLHIFERLSDGGKRRADEHPLAALLSRQPNEWQTPFEFREMLTGHLLLRGNAYAEIVSGPRGFASALVPLHPAFMRVEQLTTRRLRYRYMPQDGSGERRYTQDEILHLRGLSSDGLVGLSPVTLARTTIELAMAAEEFGARQFGQKPTLSGLLKAAKPMTDEQRKSTAQSFRDAHSGPENWHSVAVLPPGLEWQSVGMSNEDAEFLATRKFEVAEIARWFGVPPHMLGDLDSAKFNTVEQQGIDYVTHSLGPWLVRWEQRIGRDLILDPLRFFAEFIRDALLRGDTAARYAAYHTATGGRAWMSPDEVRARENLNLRGGDLDEVREGLGSTQPRQDVGAAQERRREADGTAAAVPAPLNRIVAEVGSNGHG